MAMRQTTRFSVVSSIQDDSFGSKHLPSAIYALAETARGETAACSHPRRSTFTVRALGVRSRLTRARLEPYGGRAVRCGHRKFMLTNHKVYIRANYCMRLSFGVAAAATTQRAGVASICAMRTCSSASCLWSKVARIDMSGAAAAGNGPRLRWFWRRGCRLEQRTCLSCALAKVLQDLLAAVS